jgi:hypothetical protein
VKSNVFRIFHLTPTTQLQQLDGAQIEVELEIQGELRCVCGKGVYDPRDPDLGRVLRIVVRDPSGNFEFLVADAKWTGQVQSSDIPGCDYRISFANSQSV